MNKIDIKELFDQWNSESGSKALPEVGYLSEILQKKIEGRALSKTPLTIEIDPQEAKYFVSASVEMWCRSIHSYMISLALTAVSPIWASVSGYYASHYCVRALAHILGNFQIRRNHHCTVVLKKEHGKYMCDFYKKPPQKPNQNGEHQYYWRIVKEDVIFKNNPLFVENIEYNEKSDVAHRCMANYYDHVNIFPEFYLVEKNEMRSQAESFSKFELLEPPIPDKNKFPDITNVQLMAYHRIVIYRKFITSILNDENKFWEYYKNPSWCSNYISFQIKFADNLKDHYFVEV